MSGTTTSFARDPLAPLIHAAQGSPGDPARWRTLAEAAYAQGRGAEADAAWAHYTLVSVNDPTLREAALALAANRLDVAERLIKPHLKAHPEDVAAMRMLAELAGRLGRLDDAEALLVRALELAPRFHPARQNLATVHLRRQRYDAALAEIAVLRAAEPDNPAFINLEGVALAKIGDHGDAAQRFAAVLARTPDNPRIWLSQGHALKTIGRSDEAIASYRKATALKPGLGEAWFSLANLKAYRFASDEVTAMEAALAADDGASPPLTDDDRLHLHFALGKAREDARDAAAAFGHYAEGNRIRAAQLRYDPAPIEALVAATIDTVTPDFLAARRDWGDPSTEAVFILGMPRSGSTLVEQILASHPMVEGTRELPDIEILARRLSAAGTGGGGLTAAAGAGTGHALQNHIAALAVAPRETLAQMGAAYLAATRVHRKQGRPLFIDKMPNNWAFVPFIRLILPNARIIDTRRAAMDCCFSNFKQHFARGQAFTYRMDHLARYYRAYVAMMAHMDAVAPGAVLRVDHTALVDDPEAGIRRLLDGLDLPFDPACLDFWRTERAVQTASSEQVRRPMNRDGFDQWRPFAQWLGPIFDGLGDLAAV